MPFCESHCVSLYVCVCLLMCLCVLLNVSLHFVRVPHRPPSIVHFFKPFIRFHQPFFHPFGQIPITQLLLLNPPQSSQSSINPLNPLSTLSILYQPSQSSINPLNPLSTLSILYQPSQSSINPLNPLLQ